MDRTKDIQTKKQQTKNEKEEAKLIYLTHLFFLLLSLFSSSACPLPPCLLALLLCLSEGGIALVTDTSLLGDVERRDLRLIARAAVAEHAATVAAVVAALKRREPRLAAPVHARVNRRILHPVLCLHRLAPTTPCLHLQPCWSSLPHHPTLTARACTCALSLSLSLSFPIPVSMLVVGLFQHAARSCCCC